MVKGKVLNADTGEPLSASVELWDRNGSLIRGTAHSDPESGTYRMLVPKGGAYIFQAEIQGYLSLTTSINLSEGNQYAELEQDLYVVPMVEGQKIPINNIFFVRSAAQLLPQSYQELDRLVVILNQHPTLKIELGGHTDNLGQASLNLDLSLQRVDAVKEYLVANGIDSSRLLTKGYGDTQPVARNDRELDRRRNRRVEFTILSL
jgi:outer membrane protein OmpA-like peptidoglycan-associated protein